MNPSETDYLPEAARALVAHLKLEKIPHEGPLFVQTYRSEQIVEGAAASEYDSERILCSSIYGLITEHDFSAMHVLATDELWFHLGGSPLEMLLLHPDGAGEEVVIGPDVLGGQHPQFVVPKGVWQGSRPMLTGDEGYALVANVLSPGFDYRDYTGGEREALIAEYPQFREQITRLTRLDPDD